MMMRDWLRVALQRSVLRRGLLYATIVGSVLVGLITETQTAPAC
jgi:hypothetical protein